MSGRKYMKDKKNSYPPDVRETVYVESDIWIRTCTVYL